MKQLQHKHQTFRDSGSKATRQRLFILQAIDNLSGQFTPQGLHAHLRRTHPEIGLVTVYRTIKLFAENGLVCHIGQRGRSQSYARRPSDGLAQQHHHHLVCTQCQKLVDITSCGLEDMTQKLARDTGFAINEHHLEFRGLCCQCQRQSAGAKS
jgi:Fur family ferric uptake transcriptional regulator